MKYKKAIIGGIVTGLILYAVWYWWQRRKVQNVVNTQTGALNTIWRALGINV